MTAANLSRAMRLSAPTVSEMVGRLERDGYISRDADRAISFTESGRKDAERIVSRHRMIERFLTDVVGVPWDEVHEEAERLEHAMTPRFEAYVRSSVGDALTCPHGHPIQVGERIDGVPLADCALGATVDDPAPRERGRGSAPLSRSSGIFPGLSGQITAKDDATITVSGHDGPATVTISVAETVSVTADPSPAPRTALPEQLVLGQGRYGR